MTLTVTSTRVPLYTTTFLRCELRRQHISSSLMGLAPVLCYFSRAPSLPVFTFEQEQLATNKNTLFKLLSRSQSPPNLKFQICLPSPARRLSHTLFHTWTIIQCAWLFTRNTPNNLCLSASRLSYLFAHVYLHLVTV